MPKEKSNNVHQTSFLEGGDNHEEKGRHEEGQVVLAAGALSPAVSNERDLKAVVFFSGGAGGWSAAKRTVKKYGVKNTTLLFTDTKQEDEDLYRFMEDAAKNIGIPVTKIADGRNVWQVFHDVKMLGNSRVDPCSRVLKREPAERWLKENCDPDTTVLVFGIDWTESHRFDDGNGRGVRPRYAKLGWPNVEAPMTEAPYLNKKEVLQWMRLEGLKPSRAYDQGLSHDNCSGGCVKAGKGHWAHLLNVRPEVFAEWEANEIAFNAARPGKKFQTILRDQIPDQPAKPLSLTDFRKRVEAGQKLDMFDIGGCGCFVGNE